jgi:hypothetical protein
VLINRCHRCDLSEVPLLLVAGRTSFYKQLYNKMKGESNDVDSSKVYNGKESQDITEELIKNRIRIDPDGEDGVGDGEEKIRPWLKDGKLRTVDGQPALGLPHPYGTHQRSPRRRSEVLPSRPAGQTSVHIQEHRRGCRSDLRDT